MARRLRTVAPGVPLHVVQRGNNRTTCFFGDEDFDRYLRFLRRAADEERCRIHAYCLMSNHVHLLVTPEDNWACARFMKVVNQRYAQHLNRVHERTGTPWEGRYRSNVVFSMRYVLACYRYIELNPVRANMVRHPREYKWSSYRVNAEGKEDSLLTPHDQYRRLGSTWASRRENYRALFKAHIDEEELDQIRQATNGNYALGNDRFREEIESALGRRATPGKSGRPPKKKRSR